MMKQALFIQLYFKLAKNAQDNYIELMKEWGRLDQLSKQKIIDQQKMNVNCKT